MQNLRVSQPNTPMSSIPMKEHMTAGDVPPLVSAERLSPATNNFPPRKSPLSPGDYPHTHSHSLPYSQPTDIQRPSTMTPSSQIQQPPPPPEGGRSHELIHTFKSQETIMSRELPPRDIPPHHLQYQKMARARELQHSMQVQDMTARGPPPHELIHGAQFADRHHPRLPPHDMNGSRPHTISHQEMKTREISYTQMSGEPPMNSHYSPGSLPPPNGPYPPETSYDDIRSRQYAKDNLLKRHSTEPARPGQLKLARTSQNIMHQIHTTQMDKGFPKILQYNSTINNRLDNKYSPSNMPPGAMTTEGSPISPYQRGSYNRYEVNAPGPGGPYEGGSITPSYPPGDKKTIRVRTCNACDKESQFLCSGCRGIWYCSRQCQLDDWKLHSKTCRKK